MRIAMIGARGLPATHGGVERAVEALSKRLVAQGYDVTVYGRRGYCDDTQEYFDGVRQIALPTARTKHLDAVVHTALATAHALTRGRYDVIHFHATGPALFSVFVRLCRARSVVTVQGLDWKREKWGRGARAVLRLGLRVAATVPTETIVVSRALERSLFETYGATTTYIPNGVELSELELTPVPIEGLEPNRFILFLSRLVPEKQPHLLIEAFRKLKTEHRLVIAGPALYADDYLSVLHAAAEGDPRVVFVGPRYAGEKVWLLKNAAAFVQPSTLEGLPIAVLEALAVGTPVVVSDIPENIEAITVEGERHGRTFRVEDPNDLANTLSDVLSAPAAVDSEVAALTRKSFSWNEISRLTERVYARVLGVDG
jgi:glycosyltransferase involved in cell wall biosynthesis